ncbi:uncharacterized protein NECHADRAFT_79826 [Fusarium vanettenii 77-13-4]|uniref:Uncharacterized protein n=1 Tax=Fusarium vanettenii (strain ATCC MYA-4622 / CBS 123669 / FGSC 9596 / NRRL 45880 / 77-13-4) TaxID=660122 RepID=C7Z0A9_FUSV7|nr:uncharacterized protein NECHADRAFT_79826 [Fusarium vanettenii 77-13-4]EEU42347.1 predicted protein [Fusarium vanettenii 77-13-4]
MTSITKRACCCVQPRCGLCHFEFRDKDDVIVMWGLREWRLQYRPSNFFGLEDDHEFFGCRDSCYQLNRSPCYHASCVRICTPGRVSSFSSGAWHSTCKARRHWIQKHLTAAFEVYLPLPAEVRANIAQRLLPEYAILRRMSLGHLSSSTSSVKVAAPIEESYVTFEGVTYVKELKTRSDVPDSWVPPKALYITIGFEGVLKLIFAKSDNIPTIQPAPGVWWETIPLSDQNGSLECYYDGIKLTGLAYKNESGQVVNLNRNAFSIPRSPAATHRYVAFTKSSSLSLYRMSLYQYNHPGITGFSICCNPSPVSFHAHVPDEDLSFYQSAPEGSFWIYTPLDKNERIVRIWKRASKRGSEWQLPDLTLMVDTLKALGNPDFGKRELALAFETNQGRTLLFGATSDRDFPWCKWSLLDAPNGEPGHFFFDTHPTCTRALCFESQEPAQALTFAPPQPSSPHPGIDSLDSFFWSSASVEDVREVRPCRQKNEISGLLFLYSDGRSATLGQVRLDHLDTPLIPKDAQKLYLGFTTTAQECPYVARVEILAENPDECAENTDDGVLSGLSRWA